MNGLPYDEYVSEASIRHKLVSVCSSALPEQQHQSSSWDLLWLAASGFRILNALSTRHPKRLTILSTCRPASAGSNARHDRPHRPPPRAGDRPDLASQGSPHTTQGMFSTSPFPVPFARTAVIPYVLYLFCWDIWLTCVLRHCMDSTLYFKSLVIFGLSHCPSEDPGSNCGIAGSRPCRMESSSSVLDVGVSLDRRLLCGPFFCFLFLSIVRKMIFNLLTRAAGGGDLGCLFGTSTQTAQLQYFAKSASNSLHSLFLIQQCAKTH